MAKTKLTLSAEEEAFVLALRNLVGSVSDAEPVESEDEEEVEDDEDEEELEAPERDEVESLGIKDLRELAAKYGIDEKKKADILAAFEDLYDEDDEEDEDEEADEEEDEDEEEEGYDRDSLEDLDLKELRKIAKSEGHDASDYKGMDQDAIIDLILGEEDEDEDEEDEGDDEDEEAEELDEDDLIEMSHKDLLALCKELDIKVPAALKKDTKANHKKLVAHVLDDAEE